MSKDVKNPTWEELSREFSQSYTMNQPAIDVRPQGIYLEGRMIELTKEEFTERINERIDVLKQVINQ